MSGLCRNCMVLVVCLLLCGAAEPADLSTPESVLRALVRANAEKDIQTMASLMAHEEDSINYSIGGRKYRGWSEFARELMEEFRSVKRLEIPILELQIWTRGNVAWFVMELEYIRYVADGSEDRRMVLPLRETGVLERRAGQWVLVAWHESFRREAGALPAEDQGCSSSESQLKEPGQTAEVTDLSGEWEIQEEDKSYRATLDRAGNGTYTWQNGRITTTVVAGRQWEGTWNQSGNDREGSFELLLSENGTEAKGVWWYTRVGDRANIPPRQWGGS